MTTPVKKTALTDPNNVMWVIEAPPAPEAEIIEDVIAAGPKLSAYAEVLEKIRGNTVAASEDTVPEPGSGGQAHTSPPRKASGGRVTFKTVYGKHANGTYLETADGQHRMVYNQVGNNWVFQERTSESGWEAVDVMSKSAAYKRAQEFGRAWDGPFTGERQSIGVGGKQITYRDVFGKYEHGAVIETLDGRHRMVFDSARNKWLIQERDEQDAWADVGLFAKTLAYRKALELSGSWRPPVGRLKPASHSAPGRKPVRQDADALNASAPIPVRRPALRAASPEPTAPPVETAASVMDMGTPAVETAAADTLVHAAAVEAPALQSGMPADLKDYWLRGEGALKIRWGTEGSFRRCTSELREHFPQGVNGLCANLYREATGHWPGEDRSK